ncbi:MAG: hypothetical protein WAN65_16065 [Candidatus Sulfotelmatobacter sp.]
MSTNAMPVAGMGLKPPSCELLVKAKPSPLEIAEWIKLPAITEQLETLETCATVLREESLSLRATDQESYDLCAEKLAVVKASGTELETAWEELKRPVRTVINAILEWQKRTLAPITAGQVHLVNEIKAFTVREESRIREVNRALQEAQRKEEADKKIEAAAQAEQAGVSSASAAQILDEVSVAPAVTAAPTFQKSASVGRAIRFTWKIEAKDPLNPAQSLRELVHAAADNDFLLAFLNPNLVAMNKQAGVSHENTNIPGYRAVKS